MMKPIDKLTREDILSMPLSPEWTDNAAAIHHGFFDDGVSDLVGTSAESDAPVPFDRALGDLRQDHFDRRGG